MPQVACPHYLPPNAQDTCICQGCGSLIVNSDHPLSQTNGRATAGKKAPVLATPGRKPRSGGEAP